MVMEEITPISYSITGIDHKAKMVLENIRI